MDLIKISEFEWEIPQVRNMKVPGKVFASEKLIEEIKKDKSLDQVRNVATLPGILKESIAMPDIHWGYGFSIGGVAGFDIDKGIISPGGVGFDINCGVRLLRTNLTISDFKDFNKKKEIIHSLFRTIPSGTGRGGKINLSRKDLDEILLKGSQWCVEKGYGVKEDYIHTEENGKIEGANTENVSNRAKLRGIGQLGSLGSGNHFLEIDYIENVFDEKVAKIFGLVENQIVILIHCGSRGLGHQVASDYIKEFEKEYGFPEQDRQLVNAPIKSLLGRKYLSAMAGAANFAFANRQMITHFVRDNLKHYFPEIKVEVLYDITHNIAKFEEHNFQGKEKEILVMRKGATRSLGPQDKRIPKDYKDAGQPILIPGSMGTASYVLSGTTKAGEISFSSSAHGAGRRESRTKARKDFNIEGLKKELDKEGVYVEAGSIKGLLEEAPKAYKDVDEVVRVSHEVGIGNMVARLKPIGVVKG